MSVTAKPLIAPDAERVEEQRRDEGRDVRVDDRRERPVEALGTARSTDLPRCLLLADALVHEDVGVDRHAERQHDARDAGQRQRAVEERHGEPISSTRFSSSATFAMRPAPK